MKKKIIAGAMAFVVAITMMPQMAFAEEIDTASITNKVDEAETAAAQMDGVLVNGDLLVAENESVSTYSLKNNGVKPYANGRIDTKVAKVLDEKEFDAIVQTLTDLDKIGSSAKSITVNVRGYGITKQSVQQVVAHILNCTPELFYFENQYRYSYSGNNILSIIFQLNDKVGNIKSKMKVIKREAEKFDQLVKPGMSDKDLVLLVHDYIAVNTVYDIEGLESGNPNPAIFDIYGVFGDNLAVCQGYALAAEYLLNRHGVNCGIASSDKLNHAWNVVEINGKWYHVDVTWDDPIPDNLGRVKHQYLLINDHELFSKNDGNQRKDYIASDRRGQYRPASDNGFAKAFWRESNTLIYHYKGDWYYMDSNVFALKKYDKATGKSSNVVNNKTLNKTIKWKVKGKSGSYWKGNFSRMTATDKYLYFSTPKDIYRVDLNNSSRKPTKIFHIDRNGQQIFGLGMFKNEIIFALKDSPNVKANEMDKGLIYTTDVSAACKTKIYKVETNYNQIKINFNSVKFVNNLGKKVPITYRVYYKTKNEEKFKFIDTKKTSMIIKNLSSNYRYQVKIKPYYYNNSGNVINGETSKYIQVVTNPLNKYIPNGDISQILYTDNPTKITVTTNTPVVSGGKTTCQLAYKQIKDDKFKYKSFSGNSCVVTGLSTNTTYQFKLRYKHVDNKSNKTANSRYSNIKTVKTKS